MKRGQLEHGDVILGHLSGLREQRLSDVSAQMDPVTRVFQHLGNQRGGGGFPVAAGNRDDLAGADLEKDLHFRGEHTPLFPGGQERRNIGPDSRRAEDHILIQALQVVLTQLKGRAHGLQLLRQTGKIFPGTLVTGGDGNSSLQQGLNEWGVGHPDADDGNTFSLKGCQILLQRNGHLPFLLHHKKANVSRIESLWAPGRKPQPGEIIRHYIIRRTRLDFKKTFGISWKESKNKAERQCPSALFVSELEVEQFS